MLVLVLYLGRDQGQSLAAIRDPRLRALDARGTEMHRYQLEGAVDAPGMFSILFAELVRASQGWAFQAIGDYVPFDSQIDLVQMLRDVPLVRPKPTLTNEPPPAPVAPPARAPAAPPAAPSAADAFDAMFTAAQETNRAQGGDESTPPPPPSNQPKDCPFCQGNGCNFCGGTGKT